jgi:uncharacterized protein (TIGR00369 family)
MPTFTAKDAEYAARVRESFSRFALMQTIGARLLRVGPGEIDIEMATRGDLTQQHGYVAGGVVTAIVDTACGYAAMSLMPAGAGVLTVEYKVNFLSPARGEQLLATGRVVRAGRSLTVCRGDVYAMTGTAPKPVATMLATMATIDGPS